MKILLVCVACVSLYLPASNCHAQSYDWRPVGPTQVKLDMFKNVSGKVYDMAVSPGHFANGVNVPAVMYILVDGGGIWRSNDFTAAAPMWTSLVDDIAEAGNPGFILVDPIDPDRIFCSFTTGIMYSTDQGAHWALLENNTQFSSSFTPVRELIIDPTDATRQVMYSYIDGEVNKTSDAGKTWTPCITNLPADPLIMDMEYTVSSDNKFTLFVAVKAVDGNGIWKSTDGGQTWIRCDILLADIKSNTIVTPSVINGIRMAADHRPGTFAGVYAIVTNTSGFILNVFQWLGIWTPAGNSLPGAVNLNPDFGLASNQDAPISLGIAPNGTLYAAAGTPQYSPVHQSVNKGRDWVSIEKSLDNFRPHTDIWCFAFHDSKVYVGCDGGIYRFNPLPGNVAGRSFWESLNTPSLQTHLVGGVAMHPNNPDILLVGAQDNGISLRQNNQWAYKDGGDNAKILFDGLNAYATGVPVRLPDENPPVTRFLIRSVDGGVNWSDASPPEAFNDNVGKAWYAPMAFHPNDPARIVVGFGRIYETRDRGVTWSAALSPAFKPGKQATAIAYAKDDIIWAAYGNEIFRSTDGGGNGDLSHWVKMNNGVSFAGIRNIAIDPNRPGRVYLVSWYGTVRRTDGDVANSSPIWEDITHNLPGELNAFCIIPARPGHIEVLVVGTGQGVFISTNDGQSWETLNRHLPLRNVTDLSYSAATNTLAAGIYGRGVFRTSMDDITDNSKRPRIDILAPRTSGCDLQVIIQGETATFKYKAINALNNLGDASVQWSSFDNSNNPIATSDRKDFETSIPPSGVITIKVAVTFGNGLKAYKEQAFQTISQNVASFQELACQLANLRMKPKYWWEYDPLRYKWNPATRTIVLQPISRGDLIKLRAKTMQQVHLIDERIRAMGH